MNEPAQPGTDPVTQAAMDDQRWLQLSRAPGARVPLDELPLSMPLLDRVGATAPAMLLRNTVLVAAQHLLGSTVGLIDWMHRWGLPYEQMFICGKVYSTHRLALWRLSELGVAVNPNSLVLTDAEVRDPEFSYDLRFATDVRATLTQAGPVLNRLRDERKAPKQLLVLDDGASSIGLLLAEPALACGARVAAVEQTRRGARVVHNASPGSIAFPIVNVAESAPKLGPEAELIGQSVVDELLIRMRRIEGPGASLEGRQVAIVGYGSVGRAVASALRPRGAQRTAVDIDPSGRQRARDDGVTISSIDRESREADVIIGCTGVCVLETDWAKSRRGRVYLASASSSDVEFRNDPGLRWKARLNPAPEIDDSDHQRIHADFVYGDNPAQVIVLNGGYPVNFNGALDPIPAERIQLTRALLLSGLRQAVESVETGLRSFNEQEAASIASEYARLVPGV